MTLEQAVRQPEAENHPPSRPSLPELYRKLSELILDPRKFFDRLIQVETGDTSLTVRAQHLQDPVINLREIPNPLAQAGKDSEKDWPACPMELTITPADRNKSPASESTSQLLARHFDQALLHQARETLARAGHQTDIPEWEEPAWNRDILTAAKCVFYAAEISERVETFVQDLERYIQERMEQTLNPHVVQFLAENAPSKGFKPDRETHTKEPSPGDPGCKDPGCKDPNLEQTLFGQIGATIGQHNKAALLLACSQDALDANAGAVPFILAQDEPSQEAPHQGRFIGQERAGAIRRGMTSRGWKKMTSLDPDLTCKIVHHCTDLQQAAGIINWLAGLRHNLEKEDNEKRRLERNCLDEILQRADIREILGRHSRNPEERKLLDRNIGRVVELALSCPANPQRAGETRQTRQQIADAITYAHRMALGETEITATTWGGILKAVHRWHDRINRDATRQQWEHTVQNNGGNIRSWPPALVRFQNEGTTAVELTNERMLLAEALEMRHCVHLYGARAERGTVRIFSLRDQSGGRATASLVLREGSWKEEQTRGRSNHPTTSELRECTRELVRALNQAAGASAGRE